MFGVVVFSFLTRAAFPKLTSGLDRSPCRSQTRLVSPLQRFGGTTWCCKPRFEICNSLIVFSSPLWPRIVVIETLAIEFLHVNCLGLIDRWQIQVLHVNTWLLLLAIFAPRASNWVKHWDHTVKHFWNAAVCVSDKFCQSSQCFGPWQCSQTDHHLIPLLKSLQTSARSNFKQDQATQPTAFTMPNTWNYQTANSMSTWFFLVLLSYEFFCMENVWTCLSSVGCSKDGFVSHSLEDPIIAVGQCHGDGSSALADQEEVHHDLWVSAR